MKNFDKETLDVKRIGQKILADEMTRTLPLAIPEDKLTRANQSENCNVKIFFATELLSRYSCAFLISGNLNAEKLKKLIYEVRARLVPTENDDSSITIRMDGASYHQKLVEDPDLARDNLKIELRQKQTCSDDFIMIDERSNRENNFRPYFEIKASDGFLGGINWDENLVSCVKVGSQSNKIYVWDMNWIKEVVEGTKNNLKK
jgi:hypothetical protein